MEAKRKKVFHTRPLFYGFLSLMFAIAISRYLFVGKIEYIVLACLVIGLFSAYCLWSKKIVALFIVLISFIFGLGWFYVGLNYFQGNSYEESCQITGRLSDNFECQNGYVRVVLKNVEINGQKDKNIALTIFVDSEDDVKIGDVISFNAEVSPVKLFNLGSFDSSAYRDKTPYSCKISAENIEIIDNRLTFDENVRMKVRESLTQIMGSQGETAFAVLFGDKSGIDSDLYASYKSAGVVHLLTVSGLHITFLITLLGFLLKKIRVRGFLNFLICFVFLGVYVYLCGFTPSVLRAGVIGLVLLATKLSGKCYDGLNSLGLSGIVILLISPLFALDVGFQMSFFCVLGIYVISPWLTKGLKKFLPKKIAEAISISIATQLATLPFVANIFSNLNFLSFFVNLIVIPLFSFLYPFLFISVLLTLAMPFMSFLLNVCNWGFELISLVTGFFAETHLQLNLKPLNIFVTTLFFVGFFLLSRFFMVKKKAKVVCSCSVFGIMTVILIALNFIPAQPSLLYCSNYGDSTLLLTNRQNKTLMVDYSYNFERMKVSAGIKYIDNFLFLETSTDSAIDGLEAENVFLLEEGYLDNETVLKENQQVSVDGFNFVYVFVEEKLLGVEINFDQTSVFVFKNSKHSQENVNFVVGQNYDFVLLGRREEYAENFFNSSSIVLTFNKSPCVSKNYQQDGNMFYEIDGNDYKWRVID